jgi:hypothetical protein
VAEGKATHKTIEQVEGENQDAKDRKVDHPVERNPERHQDEAGPDEGHVAGDPAPTEWSHGKDAGFLIGRFQEGVFFFPYH